MKSSKGLLPERSLTFGARTILLVILLSASFPDVIKAQIEFRLVDATTDLELFSINDGDVLNLEQIPAELSIIAQTGTDAESAVFYLNGQFVRTENIEPYSLGGDTGGDYSAYTLPRQTNLLKVEFFTKDKGRGLRNFQFSSGPLFPDRERLFARPRQRGISGRTASESYRFGKWNACCANSPFFLVRTEYWPDLRGDRFPQPLPGFFIHKR